MPDPDEWDVTTGNASGALTTRYVYDPKNHLRFVVSADGFVTEYRYNSFGQRIADITYKSFGGSDEARYYGTGSTESDLLAWSGNLSIKAKLLVEYTETKYDFRGNVTGVTTYNDLNMNRIGFSQFDQGVKGWVGWESNPNLIQGSFVTGTDTNSQKKYLQATFKASSTSQVIAINADQNNWVGVTPGERLAVKAGVGGSAGLGNLFLRIQFIDSSGNWLQPSEIEVDSKTGAQAFNTQFAGFAVVPANAARARMVLYATASTLNTNISITLTEPIISQVMTDQVSQPVYSPGLFAISTHGTDLGL